MGINYTFTNLEELRIEWVEDGNRSYPDKLISSIIEAGSATLKSLEC
jgi:hypothetical protein